MKWRSVNTQFFLGFSQPIKNQDIHRSKNLLETCQKPVKLPKIAQTLS